MSCAIPKSDLETMQRQGCFYGADGKITCQITADPISMILNDKETMFPGSVARGQNQVAPKPATNGSAPSVDGFESVARSRMWGSPAFL